MRQNQIIDLTRRMIALSGRMLRDARHPDSDLEFVITGLGPGEKLSEELRIDDKSLRATSYDKIMRVEEAQPSQVEVALMLNEIQASVLAHNREALRRFVVLRVDGFH